MIKVEFNSDDFERNLRHAAEQSANEGMQRLAAELQAVFDSVLASHGGQPIEQVEPALADACRRHDFTPDDEDLTAYADAISQGRHIVVEPQRVRF